jgi:antitoxin component of MazEF toxin-antitoxin module
LVKVRKVGGSLIVTIPKEIAELEGIKEGETIEIKVSKLKKSWFGIAKGVGPFTSQDELKAHD